MSKFIWFNLIFMEVLYNTIFDFLKFQYVLLSSEIGKFYVTLGTVGFSGVANRSVLQVNNGG